MRKAFICVTPLIFSLAACSAQTAPKPATPAATPSSATPAAAASAPSTPAAASATTAPAHPITDAQAHELMDLTGTSKIKQQLTDYFMHNLQQAPFMPKDVLDDLSTTLGKTDVNTPVVAVYQKYLSTDDATKIIEFYKTPAGKDLITATPLILGEVQKTAMQTGQTAAREVIDRHRPEIEAAQKAYQAQHAAPQGPTLGPVGPGSPVATPPAGAAATAPKPASKPATPNN